MAETWPQVDFAVNFQDYLFGPRRQVELYLRSIGGDKLESAEGENAFKKIRVVQTPGILDDDLENSSDDEYFIDED